MALKQSRSPDKMVEFPPDHPCGSSPFICLFHGYFGKTLLGCQVQILCVPSRCIGVFVHRVHSSQPDVAVHACILSPENLKQEGHCSSVPAWALQ